jgi:hypothetical protein
MNENEIVELIFSGVLSGQEMCDIPTLNQLEYESECLKKGFGETDTEYAGRALRLIHHTQSKTLCITPP